MKFNERLKMVRKENGLTQAELAERVGISINSVRLYESGKITPKIDTLRKIADALGIPWYSFYSDSNEQNIETKRKKLLKTGNYDDRIAAACEYIELMQGLEEYDSGTCWEPERRNVWIKSKIEKVAERYNVNADDLMHEVIAYSEPAVFFDEKKLGLYSIVVYSQDKKVIKTIEKMSRWLNLLNSDGQTVAVDRVEELAQIPKYQKDPAGDSTQSAGTGDENDPK